MLRVAVLVVVLLVPLLVPAAAEAQCDPFSRSVPIAIPRALQLKTTCGNGRIDTYATVCERHESGGCGHPHQTSTSCQKAEEVCDRTAFGASTCRDFGYAGGTLRCGSRCDRITFERCTLCATPTCRERAIGGHDFHDITLLVQGGDLVRAFWTDAKGFQVAEVDAKGTLSPARLIGASPNARTIPVQVGTTALALVGAQDKPHLAIVPAAGPAKLVALPGTAGMRFMPVVPVVGKNLAFVLVGDLWSGHMLLVDAAGTAHPLAPLYARNRYRRVALVPLAAGAHVVRFAQYEADFTTHAGDLFGITHDDGGTHVFLVRGGRGLPLAASLRTAATPAPPGEIAVDGTVLGTFGQAEDMIAGVKHAVASRPVPTTRLLAEIAHNDNLTFVRTATREVHIGRALHDPEDFDGPRTATLAIAVRPLP